MTVDLYIMPLSRYLSGDYISEAMQSAWQDGRNYELVTPDETVICPPGQPFGGPDAAQKRHALLPQMQELFDALPGIRKGYRPWNEASDEAPVFRRVDDESYRALVRDAKTNLEKRPSWIVRSTGGPQPYSPHVVYATYFVPFSFKAPFDRGTETLGSLHKLRTELGELVASPDAAAAHRDFRFMSDEADRLQLPLIVDK